MSDHAEAAAGHGGARASTYVWVWIGLVVLTSIEVFLAYEQVPIRIMLVALIGLSIMKAALIMSYFMHLKFERLALTLLLVPALVICICLMLIFMFPDSLRLEHWRTH